MKIYLLYFRVFFGFQKEGNHINIKFKLNYNDYSKGKAPEVSRELPQLQKTDMMD